VAWVFGTHRCQRAAVLVGEHPPLGSDGGLAQAGALPAAVSPQDNDRFGIPGRPGGGWTRSSADTPPAGPRAFSCSWREMDPTRTVAGPAESGE
jgi:hypothetical protein